MIRLPVAFIVLASWDRSLIVELLHRFNGRESPAAIKYLFPGLVHAHGVAPARGDRDAVDPAIVTTPEMDRHRPVHSGRRRLAPMR